MPSFLTMAARQIHRDLSTRIAMLLLSTVAFQTTALAQHKVTRAGIQSIAFRFQPATIGDKRAFHVEVRFRTKDAITTIAVPTHWGSATHLDGQTQSLKVLTAGALFEDTSDLGSRKLHAHPSQQITIGYDIVPLQTEWFSHPQEHYSPAKQVEFEQYRPTASEGSPQSCAPF